MNDDEGLKVVHFLDTDEGYVMIDPATATPNELALIRAVKYWQEIAERRLRNPFFGRFRGDK